jgi:hypothetical protein
MSRLFIILFVVHYGFCSQGYAQSLKTNNIHYRIIDDKIEIFYDLPWNRDSLDVKIVFFKKSDAQFLYQPRYIKGAIGKGIFSGKKRKITWYFKKEPSYLFTGSGFYFKITAIKIPELEKINSEIEKKGQ